MHVKPLVSVGLFLWFPSVRPQSQLSGPGRTVCGSLGLPKAARRQRRQNRKRRALGKTPRVTSRKKRPPSAFRHWPGLRQSPAIFSVISQFSCVVVTTQFVEIPRCGWCQMGKLRGSRMASYQEKFALKGCRQKLQFTA